MGTFSFDGDNRVPHAITVLPNCDAVLTMLRGGRWVELVVDPEGRVLRPGQAAALEEPA